jgi:hypothetical protein
VPDTSHHDDDGLRDILNLKVKVSWLRLMAIKWTASSDAARQACGKAAARWGNAQAVAQTQKDLRRFKTSPGPSAGVRLFKSFGDYTVVYVVILHES